MSRLEARISIYDVMDQVQIVARINERQDSTDDIPPWETLVVTTIQGTGETDGRTWLQDALIACMERL